MKIFFEHFGQVLLLLIWLICGIHGIINNNNDALVLPILATVGWVIYKQ